jgi:hypothetical protein
MRVPVVTILIGLLPACAFSQSLGDAAKRQATRRATESSTPAKARVYCDGDLQREADPPQGLPQVAATEAAVTDAAADDAPPSAIEAPDLLDGDPVRAELDREAAARRQREYFWRNLIRTFRARLASAEQQNEVACGPRLLVLTGG